MLQASRGPFSPKGLTFNPFPIRAAIDIGSGHSITMTVARVDAKQCAIKDTLYHTQLPLQGRAVTVPSGDNDTNSSNENSAVPFRSTFDGGVLSQSALHELKNRLLMLTAKANKQLNVTEFAAVFSEPYCRLDDIKRIGQQLSCEFSMDVRLLPKLRNLADKERQKQKVTVGGKKQSARKIKRKQKCSVGTAAAEYGDAVQILQQDPETGDFILAGNDHHHPQYRNSSTMIYTFDSYAAAAQCLRPDRMLILNERWDTGQIELIGSDWWPHADDEDSALPSPDDDEAVQQLTCSDDDAFFRRSRSPISGSAFFSNLRGKQTGGVVRRLFSYTLPFTALDAHRSLVLDVQKRNPALYSPVLSPNPMLRQEFDTLRRHLTDGMTCGHELPRWATERVRAQGSVVTSSTNGGTFNSAMRVAGKTRFTLDAVEIGAEHHFCALTDSVLAESFPCPQMVLPQTALAASVMRVLRCRSCQYLTDVSLTHAMLVDPSFWSQGRRAMIEAQIAEYGSSVTTQTAFKVPKLDRFNPNDAPSSLNNLRPGIRREFTSLPKSLAHERVQPL